MASGTPKRLVVLGSVVALMVRVLGRTFLAESWNTWRTLLRGAFEGLDALDETRAGKWGQASGAIPGLPLSRTSANLPT